MIEAFIGVALVGAAAFLGKRTQPPLLQWCREERQKCWSDLDRLKWKLELQEDLNRNRLLIESSRRKKKR